MAGLVACRYELSDLVEIICLVEKRIGVFFILFPFCLFVLTWAFKMENSVCKIILSGNEREGSGCFQRMGKA